MAACPARVDIPGFLRRMEVGNKVGAARLIRQANPLAEVCGTVCGPDAPCQHACYRTSFAGQPVQITELQRWVCQSTGADGWPARGAVPSGRRIAVLGGGPAALTAAYYPALSGAEIDMYAPEETPGGQLIHADLPEGACERDIAGIMATGIHFHGDTHVLTEQGVEQLVAGHDAVVVAGKPWPTLDDMPATLSQDWAVMPEFKEGLATVVEAVAEGRWIAAAIETALRL